MSIKKTLLAAAVAAFAFAAMPALAAAESVDFSGSTHFSVHGNTTKLVTPETSVHCETVEGTGEFTNESTGTIELTFHDCDAFGGLVKCTTSGQSSGTITTTKELPFHIETIEGVGPVVLITPNNGHFASFKCSFLASIVVSGSGVIGEITEPGFNEASETATLSFEQSEGVQKYTTVKGSETEYGLEASINSGEPEPAAQEGEGTLTFAEEGKGTITEE